MIKRYVDNIFSMAKFDMFRVSEYFRVHSALLKQILRFQRFNHRCNFDKPLSVGHIP